MEPLFSADPNIRYDKHPVKEPLFSSTFMLPDPDDVMISSAELLENEPLVVTFYRGIWCPYRRQDLTKMPGIVAAPRRPPHPPGEAAAGGPLVSFTRSNLAVHWRSGFHSLLELAEARRAGALVVPHRRLS